MAKKKKAFVAFARVGYLSKSVVYMLVGALSAAAAINLDFGEITGTEGLIDRFDDGAIAPFLLGLIGFGLLGYIVWKGIQVVSDPERHDDSGAKAFVRRAFYGVSGLAYASVSFTAIMSAIGLKQGSGSRSNDFLKRVAEVENGEYALMVLGGVVVSFGIYQAYKGAKDRYLDRIDEYEMPRWLRRVIRFIGPVGHFGRALVFATSGGLLVYGAMTVEPERMAGTKEVLLLFVQQPWGDTLLFAVGAAFVCYGLFIATKARYRRFELG